MSGIVPNSTNIQRVAGGIADETPVVVHPEYWYWRPEWRKLRDVLAGQREVKRKGQAYLPKMKGMDDEDYNSYAMRATFYNMTAQTQNGMLGQVYRKDPLVRNLPPKFKNEVQLRFAKDGTGHVNFSKTVMMEQIGMGRFGVLVDAPQTLSQTPVSYAIGYAAENIIDWEIREINGFYQLTRVLLREFRRMDNHGFSRQNPWIGTANDPNSKMFQAASKRGVSDAGIARSIATGKVGKGAVVKPAAQFMSSYIYNTLYRELVLVEQEDGTFMYVQNVYDNNLNDMGQTYTPVIRGVPLDFIPFKFFGSMSNSEAVERSPMLDIADLNLSHYRSYAELEYGRLYTALPVYYAPGSDGEGAAEYHIGPNTVWEVPADAKPPGILEYHGEGLKALETALSTKEQQIAAIGGRLMPGAKGASESSGQTVLREANEQAILLNCIKACETGMNQVIRWWLMFRDIPLAQSENIDYEINQDFLSTPIGAREMRAIQLMYADGLIPINSLYDYLQKAEIVAAEMSLEEFTGLLQDPDSFLNNPDVQARQRGFASRQQELTQANVAREADLQQQEIDLEERQVVLEENAPPPVVKAPTASPGQVRKPAGRKPPRVK